MALCVVVDGAGYIVQTQQAPADLAACNLALMSGQEVVAFQTATAQQQLNSTLQQLVAIPAASDFGAAWAAGFTTPMIAGLVAAACATLVSMFRS